MEEVIAITTRSRDLNQLSDYHESPNYSTQLITKQPGPGVSSIPIDLFIFIRKKVLLTKTTFYSI